MPVLPTVKLSISELAMRVPTSLRAVGVEEDLAGLRVFGSA